VKVQVLRAVEARRLADIVPPPLRRRLPRSLLNHGPYTVLIFPLAMDPVRSGAAAKAVARLGEADSDQILAFGADFTADALAILTARGVAVVTVSDWYWTDQSYDRIRTSIASRRTTPK
jgi:hypothetical protein